MARTLDHTALYNAPRVTWAQAYAVAKAVYSGHTSPGADAIRDALEAESHYPSSYNVHAVVDAAGRASLV